MSHPIDTTSSECMETKTSLPPAPPLGPPAKDTRIVRAAIHPAIGIAPIGNSEREYFLGLWILHNSSRGLVRPPISTRRWWTTGTHRLVRLVESTRGVALWLL